MKRILVPVILLLIVCISSADDPNGSIEYIGEIKILNLWGSWADMGYAHGYLLGPNIKEVFENYFLEMVGGSSNFELIRGFFLVYFVIPSEFQEYTQNMVIGLSDTISIYSDSLGRNIDYIDVCVISATPDLSALEGVKTFMCSSVSSWGEATEEDPELNESPAVSRNLDFYIDTGSLILDNNILITLEPDSGQDWIAIGFPGFAGCLSGMNESGISACLNMGNHQGTSQYTTPFVPICMAQAIGLSDLDFNGSGTCDVEDMQNALTEWNRCNSYVIHIVADRSLAGEDSSSVVVEVNNHIGYDFRYSENEPDIASCRMILTNHHRVLYPPVTCTRYANLLDSLTTNPDVTLNRLWNFMGAVGYPAIPGLGGTIQTMIFMPEQLKTGLAFATISSPPYEQIPEWIEWSDLFPNHDPYGIEGDVSADLSITIGPNPSTGYISVSYTGTLESISIYDIAGRKLDVPFPEQSENSVSADLSAFPEGIYIINIRIKGSCFSEDIVIIK